MTGRTPRVHPATMWINGKEEAIPPYPHHKRYTYWSKEYFAARRLADHARVGRGIALKETMRGILRGAFIPRLILLDPTTACNLHCKGCWAADYEQNCEIPFAKLDDIVGQAESLGIRAVLFTGGEPLMRADDIVRLCAKYRQISFAAFTNGTLVDEALADEAARLGNLNFFLSIEGWREQTDFRRGPGVFDQVVRAMAILKSRDIGFGFSACYHARNYEVVASTEFLDFLREQGCWFGWLFQYVPVGSDADIGLVCTPEQREYAQTRLAEYGRQHDLMLIDFWNNGHLGFGCLGAGAGFVHINARGDVEPCAFCHYADSNIYETSLLDALRSPFFRAFRGAMPFSGNPLTGCPLLNRPDTLAGVVGRTGAHSTHLGHPESVEQLAGKTAPTAAAWRPVAERLFAGYSSGQKRLFRSLLRYFTFKKVLSDRPLRNRRP